MPSVRQTTSRGLKKSMLEKPQNSMKALMSNRAYLNLLVIVFLVGLGTSPINSMKITLYQNVGQDVSFLGVDSLFASGVQIPLFFLTGMVQRISAYKRLLIGSAMLTAASGIIIIADSALGVLMGTIMLAAAYPLLLMSVRHLILRIVTSRLQTTANGICDTAYANIAGVIAMAYSGAIVDIGGVKAFMIVCFAVFAAATLFAFRCLRLDKK